MRAQSPGLRTLASLVIAVLLGLSFTAVLPVSAVTLPSSGTQSVQPISGFRLVGSAPENLNVIVNLEIPLKNQGLLSSLTREVSDPASPMFRHFLTQAEVQQDFEPVAQFNSMLSYLRSVGLPVITTAMDSVIVVHATVAQVEAYLHTGVSIYTNGTYSYYMAGASSLEGANVYASNSTTLLMKPALAALGGSRPGDNVTFVGGQLSATSLRAVYNATSLYSQGYSGKGQTVGILDFEGSATVGSDLAKYDSIFGLPPANLTVSAIGPSDPNLGSAYGWSSEIALDVEVSHTMAPQASIHLYIGSQALPLSSIIASIVGDGSVTTLSQSFGQGCECGFSIFEPGPLLYAQVLLTDQYYQLGALKGISMLGATGDSGGSGASDGPAGATSYPESSPFVTAVGGTQTYFYTNPNGTESFTQGAWSSYGFVSEGGNGGVSYLEPKPWYQQAQSTPATFASGRLEPDLSLQSGLDPGTQIVSGGSVVDIGGTSEASPLLAGLLTLVSQATGNRLGLIDPFLYALGNNPATYTKAFDPVTVGYTIPWTASFGFNLATGWGAPNIGEIEHFYNKLGTSSVFGVSVEVTNSTGGAQIEFTPGQVMVVSANASVGGTSVTSGTFTASLSTLTGVALNTPMVYNGSTGAWSARLTMGQESGISYVQVAGSSGGASGGGFQEIFAGYTGNFLAPFPLESYLTSSAVGGLQVEAQPQDLAGNPAPAQPSQLIVQSYSILKNQYTEVDSLALSPGTIPNVGPGILGMLTSTYPTGPINLMLQGDVYGFVPFIEGLGLVNTEISPTVFSAPGSVAPGQTVFIIANPVTPANLGCPVSLDDGVFGSYCSDVTTSSNFTASLVNPSGTVVSSASLPFQACGEALHACGGGTSQINGYLPVPSSATPGLYTIMLDANYSSETTLANFGFTTLNGSFYGQILVSSGASTPTVTFSPGSFYEGQTVQVKADIRYPNGQEVTQGDYTALLYPNEMANQYRTLMHSEYASGELTSLAYSPALNRWVANLTLPSPYSAGSLAGSIYTSNYYAGPFDVYVSGHSYDGVPTTTSLSNEQGLYVQPFVYLSGSTIGQGQPNSGLALSGETVSGPANLTGDVFLGSNTIQGGSVTISRSAIEGTLTVVNARVTLIGVTGGTIVASGSQLVLKDSAVGSLSLTSSSVSLNDSSYETLTPSVPAVVIQQPEGGNPYSGTLSISASVVGDQLASVSMFLDGSLLKTFPASTGVAPYTYALNTSAISDGVHLLRVVASQLDGMSSSASVYFASNAHQAASSAAIASQGAEISSQASTIQSQASGLSSANSNIRGQANSITSLTYVIFALAVVAIVALGIAIVALRRKEGPVGPVSVASN